jgi:predicted kinase
MTAYHPLPAHPENFSSDARRVWQTLGPHPPVSLEPLLVILTGLAGTGKSTFAHRLTALAPMVVVSSDRVRKVLSSPPQYTAEEDRRVLEVSMEVVRALLEARISVVRDAVTLSETVRQEWVDLAHEAVARSLVLELCASPATIRQRLQARTRPGRDPWDYSDALWEHYARMVPTFEPVRVPHRTIDTDKDYQVELGEIAAIIMAAQSNV